MLVSNKKVFFLILISIVLFSSKWLSSLVIFPNEDITFRIILESLTDSYFHYVKVFSDLNFTNDYLEKSNDFLISIPIGSIFFHSILFKIVGVYSFIILELILIFLFLYIFTSIFLRLNFDLSISILLAVFLYSLPIVIQNLSVDIDKLNAIAVIFFNLKFPRPLVTNLYLFYFLYFLVINYDKDIFNKFNIYLLGILFALIFSSSFFIFIPSIILFLFFILRKYRREEIIFRLTKFRKEIVLSSLIFIFFIYFFWYLIDNTNPDYSTRMGIIPIENKDKIFLIDFYLKRILEIKNISIFIFSLTLFFLAKKKFNLKNFFIIEVFFYNYLLSIINPIIFILISNKVAFLYHFDNFTIVSTFLYFFIIFIFILKIILEKFKIIKINKILLNFVILFLLSTNFFNSYLKIDKINKSNRSNINKIANILKTEINNNCKLLSFTNSLMTLSILLEFNNLIYLNGTFSKRSDDIIEANLINALKILNFKKDDFEKLLNSNFDRWRLKNSDMQQLFWQKYQANSFYTFANSKDFEEHKLKIIQNSPPVLAHQFAIPIYEKKRLLTKFDNITSLNYPDFLIIDKNHNFWSNGYVSKNIFNKYYENDDFIIYSKIILSRNCN